MPPRRSRDNDTIVVKGDGDDEWAAPSSPESIGSDIDFAPRNKMAIDSPQNLESPEPEQADETSIESASSASKPNNTTKPKYLNQISFRDPGSSTMEERLQMMPAKRTLPWREGVEAGSELETGGDSRRKQIRFGCLLATRGNEVPNPCHSCANGRGKFDLCIALPGFFKGACASCQLSGRPNRCSIKTNDDIEPEEFNPEDGIRSSPAVEDPDSDSRRASVSGSRRNTVKQTPERSTPTTRAQEDLSSGPPAKRARVEEPEKMPQTGWQEPPVVDTGLGSGKARPGRPPRSSLNNAATPWAHVNSSHMATRNSSTPINTRNGGSRRSTGQALADKETTVKETTRKPGNTPGTNTPQSAPSRPSSTTWASVNQTQQGSQPTFPNLAKQIPKPLNQQSKPEKQPTKAEQQKAKAEQQQARADQQQARADQQQARADQQLARAEQQLAKPPQHQAQAQAHAQAQAQTQAQAQQQQYQAQPQQQQQYQAHPHQALLPLGQPPQGHPPQGPPPQGHPPQGHPPQAHPSQGHPPQGHPPQAHPPQGNPAQGLPSQGHPQQGRPPQQFQMQPNAPPNPPTTTAFGNFVDQQNVRMSNGSTTSQPSAKVKQLPPYQPTFVTTPTGLAFASAPLIETLPKRKQLQLMGIISGLQGGIDNIQRELNQLKKTLGVDDD